MVQRADAPIRTPACPVAPLVEPLDDLLDPERTRRSVAKEVEVEEEPDRLRLVFSRLEFLLARLATLLGLDCEPACKKDPLRG
jgi:hypothetical protein